MHNPHKLCVLIHIRNTVLFILCVVSLVVSIPGITAHANGSRTVRVGYFYSEGMQMIDENGSRSGYVYDYLQRMLLYADWNYVYVGYGRSRSECLDMLENGDLDLVAVVPLTTKNAERFYCSESIIDESISGEDLCIAVHKDNAELAHELEYAIGVLNCDYPDLREELYDRYFTGLSGELVLTREEQDFIEECNESGKQFTAILNPSAYPYSYCEYGGVRGVIPDVFLAMCAKTGIRAKIIATNSAEEYHNAVLSGGADLWLDASFDYNFAEDYGYILTEPYIDAEFSCVLRKDSGNAPKIAAAVKNTLISDSFISEREGTELRFYSDAAACVQAVLDRECDAAYLYAAIAQEIVNSDVTNKLACVRATEQSTDFCAGFCIGIRNNCDKRLASIISKAADSITQDEISEILLKYDTEIIRRDRSLVALLYNSPIAVIVAVIIVSAIFGLLLLYIFSRRKRRFEKEKNIQLAAKNNELEAVVKQLEDIRRTLSGALEEAERANAAKGQFTSRMSHEIRTPLNAVIGYLTLAEHAGADEAKIADCLTKSRVASQHLLEIINDVLDMATIENGRMKIANENFDLGKLLSSLAEIFYAQASVKNIALSISSPSLDGELLIGDSLRLNQILINLLSNAVKFTPKGGAVSLSVNSMSTQNGGVSMRFEVADTGIGISKEFRDNLFTPFEQQDARITSSYGGTGLGLSITKNLVSLMGGEIDVQSEQGKGSVFTVTLPFGVEHKLQPHEEVETTQSEPKPEDEIDLTGIHILLTDDNELNLEIADEILTASGFTVERAYNGFEAVEKYCVAPPNTFDIILMDIRMPVMDGNEATRRIRAYNSPDAKIIPILAMTAEATKETLAEAEKAGMNGYVPKPLDIPQLMDTLKSTLKKSKQICNKSNNPEV